MRLISHCGDLLAVERDPVRHSPPALDRAKLLAIGLGYGALLGFSDAVEE